jgi:hypothetical protein
VFLFPLPTPPTPTPHTRPSLLLPPPFSLPLRAVPPTTAPVTRIPRYVIGVAGLVEEGALGVPISPWPAFAALRDNVTWPGIAPDRPYYFDTYVFPVLQGAGVARDSLQQAWDFVTASVENTVQRGVGVREDALRRVATQGVDVRVVHVDHFDCTAPAQNVSRVVW